LNRQGPRSEISRNSRRELPSSRRTDFSPPLNAGPFVYSLRCHAG
jgi:hypothetical protein